MLQFNRAPTIVPAKGGQTVYIVRDDFGPKGSAYRETCGERADLEAVIVGMPDGQYNDPVQVVGFNVAEGWCEDVSADIAPRQR